MKIVNSIYRNRSKGYGPMEGSKIISNQIWFLKDCLFGKWLYPFIQTFLLNRPKINIIFIRCGGLWTEKPNENLFDCKYSLVFEQPLSSLFEIRSIWCEFFLWDRLRLEIASPWNDPPKLFNFLMPWNLRTSFHFWEMIYPTKTEHLIHDLKILNQFIFHHSNRIEI